MGRRCGMMGPVKYSRPGSENGGAAVVSVGKRLQMAAQSSWEGDLWALRARRVKTTAEGSSRKAW